MSIVGGLVHTQDFAAAADANSVAAKHPSRFEHWLAGHAWTVILSGTTAFWVLVAIAVYQLS